MRVGVDQGRTQAFQGRLGGEVVYQGDVAGMLSSPTSLTGKYLRGDLRIARAFRLDGRRAEVSINGMNLGGRHQEITDRSEQCLPAHLGSPVNPVAPMGWLSFSVEL